MVSLTGGLWQKWKVVAATLVVLVLIVLIANKLLNQSPANDSPIVWLEEGIDPQRLVIAPLRQPTAGRYGKDKILYVYTEYGQDQSGPETLRLMSIERDGLWSVQNRVTGIEENRNGKVSAAVVEKIFTEVQTLTLERYPHNYAVKDYPTRSRELVSWTIAGKSVHTMCWYPITLRPVMRAKELLAELVANNPANIRAQRGVNRRNQGGDSAGNVRRAPVPQRQASDPELDRACADIRKFNSALALYQVDVASSEFPRRSLRQLVADNVQGWAGPYLTELPADPWGNSYQYVSAGGNYTIQARWQTEAGDKTVRYIFNIGHIQCLP